MKKKYCHFLATRFNLKNLVWKKTKSGTAVLNDDWLSDRFEIFEKFCLPSVMQQSELNFHWCIFFDENTPKGYLDRINAIKEKFPNISPILIGEMSELVHAFRNFILRNMHSHSHVITTRLDNDDIIHKDFVHIIQQMYRPIEMGIIDVQLGYQFSIDSKFPDLRKYLHKSNSFLSLVETATSPQTIFSRQHYDWEHVEKIVFNQEPLWIELSHRSNYVNHRQRKLSRAFRIHRDFFNLPMDLKLGKLDLIKYHLLNYFLDSFYSLQLLVLRISRKIKRKFKPN